VRHLLMSSLRLAPWASTNQSSANQGKPSIAPCR